MTKAARVRVHWLPVWLMLVSLVGFGQLLPALHFAFVSHRICAEHGETLHAEPTMEAGGRSAAVDDNTAEARAQPAPAPSDHDHEHCSILGVARSAAVFAPDIRCGAMPPPGAHFDSAGERQAHVDIALLMYAPKLAPPV